MTTDLRDLLTELVADQPEHRIDLDARIATARRRDRLRSVAVMTGTVAATAAAVTLGITISPTATLDGADPAGRPAQAGPTSPAPTVVKGVPVQPSTQRETERSQALAGQLAEVAPEIGATAGGRSQSYQNIALNGYPLPFLRAWVGWTYPVGGLTNSVIVAVEVWNGSDPTQHGVPICPKTGTDRCDLVQQRPDGSTVYRDDDEFMGAHNHDAWVEHPDGTIVHVGSDAEMVPGGHDSLLDGERTLEVAEAITVRP